MLDKTNPATRAQHIALEELRRAKWEVTKALKACLKICQGEGASQGEVTMAALEIGWMTLLKNCGSQQRDRLETRAVSQRFDATARAQVFANNDGCLDTWLVGGKPLGECMPDDLRDAISLMKADISTKGKRIIFLTTILKGCKPGKKVKDAWHEEDVETVLRKTGAQK